MYSKLFASIIHSSLWREEDHVRVLFVTLLAVADREGFVWGSRPGLEHAAHVRSGDYTRDPWKVLMSPDPDSSDWIRNPENEGRRIEEVDGGFRILNYAYYRALRNDDDRREQNRQAQHRHREKVAQEKTKASATVSQESASQPHVSKSAERQHCQQSKPCQPISEAEAEAEADVLSLKERTKESCPTASDEIVQKIYLAYPRHEKRPHAFKAIFNAIRRGIDPLVLLERTRAYAATRVPGDKFTPLPASWFNAESYNDDPEEWVRFDAEKPRRKPRPWEIVPKQEFKDLYPT